MRWVLLACVVGAVGCAKKDTPESRQAERRERLEAEADDWSRKGTVLPHERGSYEAFVGEYRREFGRNWEDGPAPKPKK